MKSTHKITFVALIAMAVYILSSCSKNDDTPARTVEISAQNGAITAGTAGSAAFTLTTAHVTDGSRGTIVWYGDAMATLSGIAPAGIKPGTVVV